MNGTTPTIGVDVFKDLINEMKNELKTDLGTKIDNINTRLNNQENIISDLGQRFENLEKHITTQHITNAEAAKSPPKPLQHNTNISSTLNSTTISTLHNITIVQSFRVV